MPRMAFIRQAAPGTSPSTEMATFRGNVGNLLQHWVLCEVLTACANRASHIGFIDAYSMAPLANHRRIIDQTSPLFDFVRERLPGEQTPYEEAWQKLGPGTSVYPSSAAFLTVTWRGSYHLLLCEFQRETVRELRLWVHEAKRLPNCVDAQVAPGDWRIAFRNGLPLSGDLILLSFDPFMFDRNGPGGSPNPGNMYPTDLDLLAESIEPARGEVLVQLSTYSANNDNPQSAVIDVVKSRLEQSGLQLIAAVRADGNMMSLILGRNVKGAPSMRSLPTRFESWLRRVKDGVKRRALPSRSL